MGGGYIATAWLLSCGRRAPEAMRSSGTASASAAWAGALALLLVAGGTTSATASEASIAFRIRPSADPGRLSAPQATEAAAPTTARPQSVPLRCQIDGGRWQPCRMEIESIGEHWWLLIGARRYEFRHDGLGHVTLGDGRDPLRSVTPRWRPDGSLCWNGLCAQGPIPLD